MLLNFLSCWIVRLKLIVIHFIVVRGFQMIKKVALAGGIIFFLILLALVLIPVFFKGSIVREVKKAANRNLNATLNFDDINLSLFKNFPDFTLGIDNLILVNQAPFAGDTLARISSFQVITGLMSLIQGDEIKVNSLKLKHPEIHLMVLKNGTANWEITKAGEKGEPTGTKAGAGFNLALKNYAIEDGKISYKDEAAGVSMLVEALDHRGSGDFSQDIFNLNTETELELTVEEGGIKYLNGVPVKLDAGIGVDLSDMKFTLRENRLEIKNIDLGLDGYVAMPAGEVDMNLNFRAEKTDFKDVLSLLPAIYAKDFENIQTSGQFTLNGFVKGVYAEKKTPAFNLNFLVENGMFRYPDIPTPVQDVDVEMVVNNPGNDLDKTEINLNKLHFNIAGEPFDAKLRVKTPLSDAYLEATMKGKIDLSKVNSLLALEKGTKIEGLIRSDLQIKGYPSALEKKGAKQFNARGGIGLENIRYAAVDLPETISVPAAQLTFTRRKIVLKHLTARSGSSNLTASGSLENLIPYILKNRTLRGNLKINSTFLDLNPWMQGESDTLQAVDLPDKIDFVMNAGLKKVLYDNLTLESVRGLITLKNKTLYLDKLKMNVLNGTTVASGKYDTHLPGKPRIEFDLDIKGLGFADAYKHFLTVQMFAPLSQFMEGGFNARVSLNSTLQKNLTPQWQDFTGSGKMDVEKATIKDYKPLNRLASLTKVDILRNPALRNIRAQFEIKNGRLVFKPFDVKLDDTNIRVAGSNGIDKTVDYILKIDMPMSKLQNQSSGLIKQLFEAGGGSRGTERLKFDVNLTGNFDNPNIQTSLTDVLKEALKKQAGKKKDELLEDTKKKILDLFK